MENQSKNKDRQSETEKYELLMNKDREINEFLGKFDEEKAKEEEEINKLQYKIEQTMGDLASVCDNIENIPDQDKANDIKKEHGSKVTQVNETKFTLEKLKIEREKLNKEMIKYQHIDKRLASEIEMNNQRLGHMNEEIQGKFSHVEDAKHNLEDRISNMKLKKEFLAKKREYLLNNVRHVNMKFETKKQVLHDNNTYKSLMEQENKICSNQSHILSMKQYIDYKQAETN